MEKQEFCVNVPWGKIACISWGRSNDLPVLMVHGYLDSAATFYPLLEYLPKTYYYVALDLPGHSKSSPFPLGPLVNHSCYVEAVRRVIDHLKWTHFILISHSLAFVIANFYNNLYPFKIIKMINLEPAIPTSLYSSHPPDMWFKKTYSDYYENYSLWTSRRNKKYTNDQAIKLLMKSRGLSEDQAAVVLSRVLQPLGNGLYKLNWEPCMKKTVGLPIPEEMLISIIKTNPAPMLNIVALKNEPLDRIEINKNNLLNYFKESIPNFIIYEVVGSHDVHITNPEKLAERIIDFLNIDFLNNVVSKL